MPPFHKISLGGITGVSLFLIVVPVAALFVLSFLSWDLANPASGGFLGFENYVRGFQDDRFIESLWITLFLVLVPAALQMVLGLAVALALHQRLRNSGLYRTVFLIPMVIPPVVVGLVWKVLFTPGSGGVNYLLSGIGVSGPDWLSHAWTARAALVTASVWEWTPFVVIMLLAALEGLPTEPLEMAMIDGANYMRRLVFVVIPLITPVMVVVALFRIIEGLRIFPLIFVMTQGGPGSSTETMNYYAYLQGFSYFKVSYAAALTVILFLVVLAMSLPFLRKRIASQEDAT